MWSQSSPCRAPRTKPVAATARIGQNVNGSPPECVQGYRDAGRDQVGLASSCNQRLVEPAKGVAEAAAVVAEWHRGQTHLGGHADGAPGAPEQRLQGGHALL